MLICQEKTEDLWDNRWYLSGWSDKQTKERAMFFFDAYMDVTRQLNNGLNYTTRQIVRTNLYKHILTLNKRGRSAIRKFRWMQNLFYDIKKNGILKPILIINYGNERKLHTGNHRLVCAMTLGIEIMSVCLINPEEYGNINRRIYSG